MVLLIATVAILFSLLGLIIPLWAIYDCYSRRDLTSSQKRDWIILIILGVLLGACAYIQITKTRNAMLIRTAYGYLIGIIVLFALVFLLSPSQLLKAIIPSAGSMNISEARKNAEQRLEASRARGEILDVKIKLQSFHMHCGRFPSDQEGLKVLLAGGSAADCPNWAAEATRGLQPRLDLRKFHYRNLGKDYQLSYYDGSAWRSFSKTVNP